MDLCRGKRGAKRLDAEAEVSEGEETVSAIGGVEENAERDATRSAIASSWLHTSGGRRRTHRARQADARGEIDWRVSVDSTIARVHQHGATAARISTPPTSHTGGPIE